MINNTDYTICSVCGAQVIRIKFCTECGAPISQQSDVLPPVSQIPMEQINSGISKDYKPFVDSDLTLLGNFCKRSVATVGGDGYDEIVLYEDKTDGSYQIHTFSKYEYMPNEVHHAYKAKDGAYNAMLELVGKLQLDEYEGKSGAGLCGGMYICKYMKDGVIHRVTTDNIGIEGPALIVQVGKLLGSYIGEEI